MIIDGQLDRFRERLLAEHASSRTIESYSDCARTFIVFLETHHPGLAKFQQVSRDVALDYQRHLQGRRKRDGQSLSTRTLAVHIKALRRFFAFLGSEDTTLRNPFATLAMPREGRPLPRPILSQHEVLELLHNMKGSDPVGLRNLAIVELLYSCGLRTIELCRLRTADLDLQEQTATILYGKGNKDRIVPIGMQASRAVRHYLDAARHHMLKEAREDPGFLFLSQRGNAFDRSSLNKCVMRAVSRLLLTPRRISGYTFRHSIASHLLANGADVTYIARLLGHESIRTTQRYLRLDIGDLTTMHHLYHPRERCQTDRCRAVPRTRWLARSSRGLRTGDSMVDTSRGAAYTLCPWSRTRTRKRSSASTRKLRWPAAASRRGFCGLSSSDPNRFWE